MVAVVLTACSADSTPASGARSDALIISGAGATFPQPLYERWIQAYAGNRPEVSFQYAAVGSGEGVRRFLAGEVDFGASDGALSDAELATPAGRDALMLPMTAGMIALAYNLPGVEGLRLSREAVVGIFSGEIRAWDDARIQMDNPGLKLPKRSIAPVVRLDGSGTTQIFTRHLSAISAVWREGPGVGKRVLWPDVAMQVNYNEGVAQRVRVSEGSIGYMEYEFAQRIGLPVARLQNRAGEFIAPSPAAGTLALASAGAIPDDLRLFVPDPAAAGAYPIVGYTWVLLRGTYADQARLDALKGAMSWGLGDGQSIAEAMGYVPLPDEMVALARARLDRIRLQP
ncbi:phosphate ABC transporter substrate-binding protein PstS [Thiohalocapsa marina]|uniref:Phosphate-binding protein PstS n=2 Tax=Thiohalocapsa marina TaxID=424902 RepID=A0A5M8FNH4_9GAMM|nr:phosphate ABC transporter substrate-binding protein PstS [Thiohalocapsa marina]